MKRYLFDRYGHDSVCYVGTYNILKIKSALKECANHFSIPFKEVNYASSFYPNSGKNEAKTIDDFFRIASGTIQVKKFFNSYPEVVNSISLIHNSIKARSIHAAAVIVTPKTMDNKPMQIYDWFPVRKVDGVLVSEFDGYELDELGFLKNDILGISQADKIKYCIALIKQTEGIDIDKTKIPLYDEMVYESFRQGMTQDIFQFNGGGMTNYLQRMAPTTIEDLIAANALYRPGSMTSGLHERYAKVKNGLEEPKYYWGIKEITKKTYGTMPYQEQILEIARTVADFSLSEADILRRAIGKKDHQKISSFKDQFVSRAISKGCPEDEAYEIWQIIEDNSDYSFNRSHSAAYALLGYVGMWLKVHYPVHFYNTALQFADDKIRPLIIAEINTNGDIRIMPPDINKSDIKYTADYEKRELYWSLASIKHIGDKAIEIILKERQENGKFFSLTDFLERCKKGAVNKRVVENLILTGSFDSIFCKSVIDRKGLIAELYNYLGVDIPEHYLSSEANKEVFWHKHCKVLGGIAEINFENAVSRLKIKTPKKSLIRNPSLLQSAKIDEYVLFGGFVEKIKKINSKKGVMAKIDIELNGNIFKLVIWPDDYENLNVAEGDLVIGVSLLKFDSFEGFNCLYSGRGFELIKI